MIRNLLRFLGWVSLLVSVSTGVVALVYFLSERPQKVAIEQRVLDTVDIVREDGTTPRKVVDVLDRFADQTVAVRGDVVLVPAPDSTSTAPHGEPADRLGLKPLPNPRYPLGYDHGLPAPPWSSYPVLP